MNNHATHLALVFAADCDPKTIGLCFYTAGFEALARIIGEQTEERRQQAEDRDDDFYSGLFVEAAATEFNHLVRADTKWRNWEETVPEELVELLMKAGQAESDAMAN